MRTFTFGFGTGTQSVEIPEDCVRSVIEGRPAPAVDAEEAALAAMRRPIGSAPLAETVKKGDKVCIICADVTRSWNRSDQFVIHVVNELNLAGIPDEDITILFAQGTHRTQTREEDIRVVGEEAARRIRLIQHDSRDKDGLVLVGTTTLGTPVWINKHAAEADKIILVNGITTHLFAGYSGGRKLILPGVAGWDTIQSNHCHALADTFGGGVNPKTRATVLEDNPVSDDMQEAADMLAPCFLIHSVINAEGEICRIVGGDPHEAWMEGVREVARTQRAEYAERADVTFACAGGYPKDVNLYQGSKFYDAAAETTKKGGVIIAIVEAREIGDPPEFMASFAYETEADMERDLRKRFTIPFFAAFNLFCMAHKYTIYMVTKKENFDAVRRTGQIPAETVEDAWRMAREKLAAEGKTDITVNIMPHGGAVIPVLKQ